MRIGRHGTGCRHREILEGLCVDFQLIGDRLDSVGFAGHLLGHLLEIK